MFPLVVIVVVLVLLACAAVSRVNRKSPLPVSDRNAANFLAGAVKRYGPLTRQQVQAYASQLRSSRMPGAGSTAYGLERVASEMKPGELISGSVPWRKRF